jgi:hypothetical protein
MIDCRPISREASPESNDRNSLALWGGSGIRTDWNHGTGGLHNRGVVCIPRFPSDPFQFCSCCLYLYFDRDRHNNELHETRHEATTYNNGMRLMPGKQSEGIFAVHIFILRWVELKHYSVMVKCHLAPIA